MPRQFVQQLKDGALRRGKRQRPIRLAPRLHDETVLNGVVFVRRPIEARKAWYNGFLAKQLSVVVVEKARAKRKIIQPRGRLFRAVQMNLFSHSREVMSIALEFERGATADDKRLPKLSLQRYDDLLPCQRTAWPAKYARCELLQKPRSSVMMPELA